jgi:hypothetical protein
MRLDYLVSSLTFNGLNSSKFPDQVRFKPQATRIQDATLPDRHTAGGTGNGKHLFAGEVSLIHASIVN